MGHERFVYFIYISVHTSFPFKNFLLYTTVFFYIRTCNRYMEWAIDESPTERQKASFWWLSSQSPQQTPPPPEKKREKKESKNTWTDIDYNCNISCPCTFINVIRAIILFFFLLSQLLIIHIASYVVLAARLQWIVNIVLVWWMIPSSLKTRIELI